MVRERARDNNKVNDHHGAIAKWLRRLIRNQFPFRGAGSSPAGVGQVLFCLVLLSFCWPVIIGSLSRLGSPD